MLIKSKSKENEIQTAVYQDSTYGSDPAHVPALKCENLTKRYGSTLAVSSFSLVVQKGEIISLVGPSGCGKTTLLRLIGGFTNPDSGSIEIAGSKAVADHRFTPPEKRNIGMVFQEGALFPHMNVTQNVAYGLHRGNHKNQQVQKVLELVGMTDLANRMPHELSGGQQQRVALARALAPEPELILLDEPFSNLDPSLREQVRRDMVGIIKASKVTAIFVTHDQE
jgi:iron(III) transport system ATP-binding protein